MSVTVKICGLREPRTLDAALEAGADMVGFVSFPASPRHISAKDAKELGRQVGRRARKVLLVADPEDDALTEMLDALEPEIIQLHGHETLDRIHNLRSRHGLQVMKAWAIESRRDLDEARAVEDACDYMLFDARAPEGATRPGGNATSFDWTLLRDHAVRRPWLLAGGLDAANVGRALQASGAPGVDVSSGVERSRGEKDAVLIKRFVAIAKARTNTSPLPAPI